jgi:peptidoglycan/LPS O-acetylase OafA/YrhL
MGGERIVSDRLHAEPARSARSVTGLVLPRRSAALPRPVPAAKSADGDTPDVPSATGQLPGLDGLRAFAVAAVIAYHLGVLPGGFLGVDVFFVVSGFLITRLLLAERVRTDRISLRAFWARRFRRLVPALLVVVAAVAVASRVWLPRFRLGDIRNDAFSALGYVANWRFTFSGQSYFAAATAPSPFRHVWSLAIEEQFYVLWPLLVVLVIALGRRHAHRAVGLLAAVGTVVSAGWMALSSSQGDLSRTYYGTDTRIFALFAGAWLSTWWDARIHRVPDPEVRASRRQMATRAASVSAIGLVVLFVVGTEAQPSFYRWGFQLTAALSVVAVAGVATGGRLSDRVFANPVLIWIGRRSYGLYLWSWPVQVFATERFRLDGARLDAAVVVVSLALAAVSYWLVEQPVRLRRAPAGFRRTYAPQRTRPGIAPPTVTRPSYALAGVSIIAVLAVVTGTSIGAPAPPSYLRSTDRAALAGALAPAFSTGGRPATTRPLSAMSAAPDASNPGPFSRSGPLLIDPSASVRAGSVRGRPLRVLVTGDSVGWTLAWNLRDRLSPDLQLDDRAVLGCGALPATGSFIVGGTAPEQYPDICQEAHQAEAIGLGAQPDVVFLVVGAWEVYDQEFGGQRHGVGDPVYARFLERQIQDRLDLYRSYGLPTILPLVPCYGRGAARLGREREDPKRVAWVNARIRDVAARNTGWVRLVDPTAQLCTPSGRSRTKTPTGLTLREDGAHFTEDAATWFWKSWLGGQVGAALQGTAEPGAPATTPAPAPTGPTTTDPPAPTSSTPTSSTPTSSAPTSTIPARRAAGKP